MQAEPIYKIGICALHGARILLVKPKGKKGDGKAPWVLPRGTRAWRNAAGELVDARTLQDAIAHADALEDMRETAAREAHEEAGIPPTLFAACNAAELGVMEYHSESGHYPIMWFLLQLDAPQIAQLETPQDSAEAGFFTLQEFADLAASGAARAGYVAVAEAAFAYASARSEKSVR